MESSKERGIIMKDEQFIQIKIEKVKQTPQSIKINSLKFYLSQELDKLINDKEGTDLEDNELMSVSKKDLNKLYFNFVNRIERQKDFYFPDNKE
jgi:hypothetical protein